MIYGAEGARWTILAGKMQKGSVRPFGRSDRDPERGCRGLMPSIDAQRRRPALRLGQYSCANSLKTRAPDVLQSDTLAAHHAATDQNELIQDKFLAASRLAA